MKHSVPVIYTWISRILIFYALLILPASFFLPDWVSFENGPVENTQVVLLLACALMCISFFRRTSSSPSHKIWLPSAGVFLILAGRELSWGRVFLVRTYSAAGEPILISPAEMPFLPEIHAFVGLFSVLCLYFLIRYTPWKQIFREIPFPWIHFFALIVTAIIASVGDHHAIFHTIQDQQIEELTELLMYAFLGHTAWYYYLHFKK